MNIKIIASFYKIMLDSVTHIGDIANNGDQFTPFIKGIEAMKIHLQYLELYLGDNGKVKYHHKRKRQWGKQTAKALCGKNSDSYTVKVPRWYEHKKTNPGSLCQHCVTALEKQKQNVKAA